MLGEFKIFGKMVKNKGEFQIFKENLLNTKDNLKNKIFQIIKLKYLLMIIW